MTDVSWMDQALENGWQPPEDVAAAAAADAPVAAAVGYISPDAPEPATGDNGQIPVLAAPRPVVVNIAPPASAGQTVLTPDVSPGAQTTELKTTIVTIVVHAIAGIVAAVNPNNMLSPTEQTWLMGEVLAGITLISGWYNHSRTQVKKAALSASMPVDLPTGPAASTA